VARYRNARNRGPRRFKATTDPASLVHAGRSTYRAFELNPVSPDDESFFSAGKHLRAFPFPISDAGLVFDSGRANSRRLVTPRLPNHSLQTNFLRPARVTGVIGPSNTLA
jgi:hypothetical protein